MNENNGGSVIYVILGSGGHTAEIAKINKALLQSKTELGQALYHRCFYLVASNDTTSRRKIISVMKDANVNFSPESFIDVPRSRNVGQHWITAVFTSIWALIFSVWLVWRGKPTLILCNGPGTCVPFCVAAYFWRVLRRLPGRSKIVFVESYCRVTSLSLSGILLLPFVDLFVVQWEPLWRRYQHKSNVKFFGRLM